MTHIFTDEENQAWQKTLPAKRLSACLAIRAGDSVLMVKAGYKDYWTFPSGVVDEGESPQHAAIRETWEETGHRVTAHSVRPLGIVYMAPNNGYLDGFNFAFTTDVSTTDLALTIPNDEIESFLWVPLTEIATYAKHRPTYEHFQRVLLGELPESSYTEVHP